MTSLRSIILSEKRLTEMTVYPLLSQQDAYSILEATLAATEVQLVHGVVVQSNFLRLVPVQAARQPDLLETAEVNPPSGKGLHNLRFFIPYGPGK